MAEWLRRGLQILARRFDSGSGLQISFYRLRENDFTLPISPKFIPRINTSCYNRTVVSYALDTTVLYQNILFALSSHYPDNPHILSFHRFDRPLLI